MDEEALSESIQARIEQDYEKQQAELLANNRELYAAIDEMKQQLIETGKQRDELRAALDQVGVLSPRGEEASNGAVEATVPSAPAPPPRAPRANLNERTLSSWASVSLVASNKAAPTSRPQRAHKSDLTNPTWRPLCDADSWL